MAVINGEDYIQPSLIPVLNSKMLDRDSDSSKIESLTRRELEVLKMLSYGTYNKEIAEHLNISERTVKNHVSNIFKKIGVTDRTQAAVFALLCVLMLAWLPVSALEFRNPVMSGYHPALIIYMVMAAVRHMPTILAIMSIATITSAYLYTDGEINRQIVVNIALWMYFIVSCRLSVTY